MNYKVQKQNLLNRLEKMYQFVDIDDNIKDFIDSLKEEIKQDLQFNVLCTGEFSAGKSTFLNNFFIKKDILPTKATETTAKLTFIKYAENEKIVIHYLDNTSETINEVTTGILEKYLAKNGDKVKQVDKVEVFINSEVLKEGVTIVDSPGLGAPESERVELTNAFIPQADAVLYFISALQAWKGTEKDFIENKILNKDDLDKTFFLLNYWDVLDESEYDEVLDYVKTELNKSIEIVKRDLGNVSIPPIIPISAKTKYNFDVLDKELISYLSSKKGIDILNQKIAKFEALKQKILKLLDTKIELFNQDKDKLQEKLKILKEEIDEINSEIHYYKKTLYSKVEIIVDEWIAKTKDLYKEIEHNIIKKLEKQQVKKSEDLEKVIKKVITNQTTYFKNIFNSINKRFDNKIQDLAEEEKAKFNLGEYFVKQKNEDIYAIEKTIKTELKSNKLDDNISTIATIGSVAVAGLLSTISASAILGTLPIVIAGIWYQNKKEQEKLETKKDNIEEEISDFIEMKMMELENKKDEIIATIINNIKTEIIQAYEAKEKEYKNIIDKYETNEVEKIDELKKEIEQI